MQSMVRRLSAFIAVSILLGACAAPTSAPVQTPAPAETAPAPSPPPSTARETTAVASLMDSARVDAAAGRLPDAAATLERALRLEPRNPRLWQELARVRLAQGDFVQAEQLAQRSNSWAGSDSALRAENARIIEDARARR